MNLRSASERPIRLRDRLREETQAAILAAAEEVFAAEGLHRARMEAIATRAGIAVGTLYNHFEDREALLGTLIRMRREALLARLDTALAETGSLPFAEALRRFLHAFVEHWEAHRGFLAALFQTERVPHAVRMRGGRTIGDELLVRAEELVRRGLDQGVLDPSGADLFPAFLVAMARTLFTQELDRPRRDARGDVGRIVDLFLRGAAR